MVVDGELLVEEKVIVKNKPENLNLLLGNYLGRREYPGRTTSFNIFSIALNVDQMKSQTRAGDEKCGVEGDFLGWEKSAEEKQWTLHSKARWIYVDGGIEGPCSAEAKMNVFPMNDNHWHSECMRHCKKLGGRSPSVRTKTQWEYLLKEVKAVSPDPSKLPPRLWLSATEGDRPPSFSQCSMQSLWKWYPFIGKTLIFAFALQDVL